MPCKMLAVQNRLRTSGDKMGRKFEVIQGISDRVEEDLNKLVEKHPDLAVESHSVSLHPGGQTIISVVIVSWGQSEPVHRLDG